MLIDFDWWVLRYTDVMDTIVISPIIHLIHIMISSCHDAHIFFHFLYTTRYARVQCGRLQLAKLLSSLL